MYLLVIILLTLLFSAFFSGMEIAYVSANKLRLEMDKLQSPFNSGILKMVTRKSGEYIATMLVGNNIALVIYGIAFARLLDPILVEYIHSTMMVLLVQTLISTFVILLLAEFLPKTLFRLFPNSLLNLFALPIGFFYVLFYPVTRMTMWLIHVLLRRFLSKSEAPDAESRVFSRIDLDHLVREADQSQNAVRKEVQKEVRLFRNALDFSKVKLREIMVPRNEITMLDVDTDIETLRQKFVDTGYSRILIYEDNIDNIIGYVHSSAIFMQAKSIRPFIKNVLIVPETMAANKLLSKFIRDHRSIALVVDEFGGTAGLVTSEDILEEIFGEIEDEHDTAALVDKKINDREYIFSGRFDIDLINEKYQINIPESEEYETLAGFILYHYESIPKVNTIIHAGRFNFKILKASYTKIELVYVTILEE
ncbi:MAG: hemolysin family protein [Bacteroidota bacterium]